MSCPSPIDEAPERAGSDAESLPVQIGRRLERAAASNLTGHFFTALLTQQALLRAAHIERLWREQQRADLPPRRLQGLAVVIKDNIQVQGIATTCGSVALARPAATRDAWIVRRLEGLGAILLGKTNMDEAALGASGRNIHFGDCCNPNYPGTLSGGSSSGSAAAVAAGLAPLGIGTDTLGSTRIPAALCGIVGFKPTHQALMMQGVVPLYPAFDTLGLLTRSLPEAARCAAALLPRRPDLSATVPAPVRLLVLSDAALSGIDPRVAERYGASVRALGKCPGIQLRELASFDFYSLARAALWTVARRFSGEIRRSHTGYTTARALLGDELRELTHRAIRLPPERLDSDRRVLRHAVEFFVQQLQQSDALLTPTCPVLSIDIHDPLPRTLASFVAPANVVGLPAVVWPHGGGTADALSLQLIGRAGSDMPLLALAAHLAEQLPR
jgi:aspartyl-tRNA(Asn)/glutamyl-tRNA(Gln) amidotransferase subunit A